MWFQASRSSPSHDKLSVYLWLDGRVNGLS
jgi:hypothetical protein